MPVIALNAMGGDHAPTEIVEGARLAKNDGIEVVLVGDPERLTDYSDEFAIVPATEVIEMCDDPEASFRAKRNASVRVAAKLVRHGDADALVDCGNSGATIAAATIDVGRVNRHIRPSVAARIPKIALDGTISYGVLLDAGANPVVEKPDWFVDWAVMGSVYAASELGINEPRVGLLSNGEEDSKGTPFVKEAHILLKAAAQYLDLNFVGNVEGGGLFADDADIMVTDGFTGNTLLKQAEKEALMIGAFVATAFQHDEETQAAYELMRPHLRPLKSALDRDQTGGSLILGTEKVCVMAHGSSGPVAVQNAIHMADKAVHSNIIEELRENLARVKRT